MTRKEFSLPDFFSMLFLSVSRLPKNFIRLRSVQETCLLTPEEEAFLDWPRFIFWLRKGLSQLQKEQLNPFKATPLQVSEFLKYLQNGASSLKEITRV